MTEMCLEWHDVAALVIYEIIYAMSAMTARAWHVPVPMATVIKVSETKVSRRKNFEREVVNKHCLWMGIIMLNLIIIIHTCRPTYILGKG